MYVHSSSAFKMLLLSESRQNTIGVYDILNFLKEAEYMGMLFSGHFLLC